MATTHRHRKLIEQYPTNSTFYLSICPVQCNFVYNPTRICATECINYCPLYCLPVGSSPTPAPATTPENLPTPPDHHHHHISLPLKISLVFIIATFIYTLYKLYTMWFRSRPRRTPPPPENQETFELIDVVDHPIWYIRTTGLPPAVIEALAVVKYKAAGGVEGSDCSVCLTEFEEDDMLRLLPKCKHAFHVSCIDTWLRSHTNCPLCRAVIVDNAVDAPPPERNDGDLGVIGEIDLGVSSIGDGDREEASGSSGLRIGESDEDDVNNSSLKNDGS